MPWAQKRKLIYISILIVIFLLVVVLPLALNLYKAPTCFDGKQNQDEVGIDCGGSCSILCPVQYVPLNVVWSRFSKVSDGFYNVLAYVENPNLNAGAANLDYHFKLYDDRGVLLSERFGRTFAPASRVLAIFAADLSTGNFIPQRVNFSFTSDAVWVKQESRENNISISEIGLSREDIAPRLSARLTNKTIDKLKNIEAVAIIYNAAGNTISFSRTVLDSLNDKESKLINFNWPKPFFEPVARTEIVLKILN